MYSMWKIMLFFYLKPHKHCITPNNVLFLQRQMTPLIPNYRMKFVSLVKKIDNDYYNDKGSQNFTNFTFYMKTLKLSIKCFHLNPL